MCKRHPVQISNNATQRNASAVPLCTEARSQTAPVPTAEAEAPTATLCRWAAPEHWRAQLQRRAASFSAARQFASSHRAGDSSTRRLAGTAASSAGNLGRGANSGSGNLARSCSAKGSCGSGRIAGRAAEPEQSRGARAEPRCQSTAAAPKQSRGATWRLQPQPTSAAESCAESCSTEASQR